MFNSPAKPRRKLQREDGGIFVNFPIAWECSVTDREEDADSDHASRGERIRRLDAEDENAKTVNGVHPEPAFPARRELNCSGAER
jgi:hypothetical protein